MQKPERIESGLVNFELFDIENDPTESNNLVLEHPDIFEMMMEKYNVSFHPANYSSSLKSQL